jgi:hypothetical protein
MAKLLAILCLLVTAGFAQQNGNPATAKFPTTVATDTDLGVACNSARTSLAANIDNSTLTVTVLDGTKLCYPSYLTIGSTPATSEVVKVCSISGNTLTLCASGRGVHSTATSHTAGDPVTVFNDSNYLNQTNAEVKAIQTGLGAGFSNTALLNRAFSFLLDSTYDFGGAAAGRARDAYIGRDLYVGKYKVSGATQTISGTSLTLDSSHNGKILVFTSNFEVTVTVPSGLGDGFSVTFIQTGTGKVTVSSAIVVNPHSFTQTFGVGASASVLCYAANACILQGDIQ